MTVQETISIGVAFAGVVSSLAAPVYVVPTRSSEIAFYRDLPAADIVDFSTSLTIDIPVSGAVASTAQGTHTDAAVILNRSEKGALMNVLASIRELTDGWMGSETLAPTAVAVDELSAASDALDPQARIAPAADGSIIIEWETHDREYLVSIEHDNTILFVEEDPSGALINEREEPYSDGFLRSALSSGRSAA